MGDILDALIDPGYQTDDLMYLVTKLEVKIELGSPFWARPKLECQLSWPLGSHSRCSFDLYFYYDH